MVFVTDRTEADVLLGTAKGKYRAEDLNRVESAVQELCILAHKLDIHVDLITKTDWSGPGAFAAGNWPTQTQLIRYLENVVTLCEHFPNEVKLPTSMEKLDFRGANAIEQALEYVYNRVTAVLSIYRFSGELYAGEEFSL